MAALRHVTSSFCGSDIAVSELRHVVKTILLYVIDEDPQSVELATHDSEDDESTDPIHKQFGHSDKVGTTEYAVLDESAPTTRLPYFQRVMEISYRLHTFYGVGMAGIDASKDGKIVCVPNEKATLNSMISVSSGFYFRSR